MSVVTINCDKMNLCHGYDVAVSFSLTYLLRRELVSVYKALLTAKSIYLLGNLVGHPSLISSDTTSKTLLFIHLPNIMSPPNYQVLTLKERSAVDLSANIMALVRLLYLKSTGTVTLEDRTLRLLNSSLKDAFQRVRDDPQWEKLGDRDFKDTFEELRMMVYDWAFDGGCEPEEVQRTKELLDRLKTAKKFWEKYVLAEVLVRATDVPEREPNIPEEKPNIPDRNTVGPERKLDVSERKRHNPRPKTNIPEREPAVSETKPEVPEAKPDMPRRKPDIANRKT